MPQDVSDHIRFRRHPLARHDQPPRLDLHVDLLRVHARQIDAHRERLLRPRRLAEHRRRGRSRQRRRWRRQRHGPGRLRRGPGRGAQDGTSCRSCTRCRPAISASRFRSMCETRLGGWKLISEHPFTKKGQTRMPAPPKRVRLAWRRTAPRRCRRSAGRSPRSRRSWRPACAPAPPSAR